MFCKRENMDDFKEDNGYVEIDPTGRYGRVCSKLLCFSLCFLCHVLYHSSFRRDFFFSFFLWTWLVL